MKTCIIFILTLISYSSIVSAQNSIKTDTIKWSSFQIIIELPLNNHSKIETYEEGFFRTISCSDSTIITVHCGTMVNLPLIDTNKYIITSKFVLGGDVRVLRGYSAFPNNGIRRTKYFREENYFKYGITVMYENADESKLCYYDSILNNIKVINITNPLIK
jgi:hypothetical protein